MSVAALPYHKPHEGQRLISFTLVSVDCKYLTIMLHDFAYVAGLYVNVVQIQVPYYIADHTTEKYCYMVY
jgi:hypothetical protein